MFTLYYRIEARTFCICTLLVLFWLLQGLCATRLISVIRGLCKVVGPHQKPLTCESLNLTASKLRWPLVCVAYQACITRSRVESAASMSWTCETVPVCARMSPPTFRMACLPLCLSWWLAKMVLQPFISNLKFCSFEIMLVCKPFSRWVSLFCGGPFYF